MSGREEVCTGWAQGSTPREWSQLITKGGENKVDWLWGIPRESQYC